MTDTRDRARDLFGVFATSAANRIIERNPNLVADVGRRVRDEAAQMDQQLDRVCRSISCRIRSFFRGVKQR